LKIREHYENQIKILEENLSMRDQELFFLKERLKNYDDNANEEQFKIFENEINNIREMLKEKTLEFLKMENIYKKNHEEYSINFNKVRENLEHLKDENTKFIEALKSISSYVSSNNIKKIGEIISNLEINNSINNNPDKIISNIQFSQSKNDYKGSPKKENKEHSMNFLNNKLTDLTESDYPAVNSEETLMDKSMNKNENTFANKVLEEFDKVFNNELKRIQKHYKKFDKNTESPLRNRSSISQRRSSVDKNYIVWKPKTAHDNFHESLRSSEKYLNKSTDRNRAFSNNNSMVSEHKNSILNQTNSMDVHGLLTQAKARVRSSIFNNGSRVENIPTISNFSFQENLKSMANESILRKNVERDNSLNKSDILNNSKMSFNQIGGNNSSIVKAKKQMREAIDRE